MSHLEEMVLGIDVGSGGCKVTCLRRDGSVVSEAYVPYPNRYPRPGWVEQDPDRWVSAAFLACTRALDRSCGGQPRVVGMAFSGPHHIAVMLDDENRPVRNAIMLSDQRSGKESRQLADRHGDYIYSVTRNVPSPTWTISHLAWLRSHEPDCFRRARRLVFMKDYVRAAFTSQWNTDYIDAEGSLLFDVRRRRWDPGLLSMVGLEAELLPPVGDPCEVSGTLTEEAALRLGCGTGIPVFNGTADTATEALGSGALAVGDGLVKLATAGNTCVITDAPGVNRRAMLYEYLTPGTYYRNCATNSAAAAFRWFTETFFDEAHGSAPGTRLYADIDLAASSIPPGSAGLLFHPFLVGERSPHWDPQLRASFLGVTAAHRRPHFARAVLEGVAMSMRDAARDQDGGLPSNLRLVGGGSNSAVWSQIMADVLNTDLIVPRHKDASFGTALIAAYGLGWFDSLPDAVAFCQHLEATFVPDALRARVYDDLFALYVEATEAIKITSARLTEFDQKWQAHEGAATI